MSLTQGFPSTFSTTQTTIDVLHNLDNETKKIYNDVNAIMAADGHAHTGNGSDGAILPQIASMQTTMDTTIASMQTTMDTTIASMQTTTDTTLASMQTTMDTTLASMQTTMDNFNVGVPGLTDFIASGRKISTDTGLNISISAGKNSINGFTNDFTSNSLTLDTRMASLIYDKLDGTTGKVNAVLPQADVNTIVRYDFTAWDGVNPIPNSAVGVNGNTIAVANALTKTGTVNRVDGHVGYAGQSDGSTGYFTSANSTGFPTGSKPIMEIDCLLTVNSLNANQYFIGSGSASANFAITISSPTTGNLGVVLGGTNYDTGFTLEIGKTYPISICSDGTTVQVYVQGVQIYSITVAFTCTASLFNLLRYAGGGYYSGNTIHYVELRKAVRTPAQIAQIANNLLLPCIYDGVDIRSILPTNSISLGYAKTSSTSIIEIDSNSYKYGIRQGATGGNRRVALGWKYFSGATSIKWDNPFGTRKIKTYYTWAQDANGTNETDVISGYFDSANHRGVFHTHYASSSQRISVLVQSSGATYFNNTWQTTGYIQCYAEVIE